jgi:hypothetical protein
VKRILVFVATVASHRNQRVAVADLLRRALVIQVHAGEPAPGRRFTSVA